jgi:hypothetical protein
VLVGDTTRVPLVAFVPVQLPEAVHEVALVEDQVTVEILPAVMLVGLAESATVGRRPSFRQNQSFSVTAPAVTVVLATAGSGTTSTAGEASTKGESAIIEASALASRALAL